jgi:hypothetical protein
MRTRIGIDIGGVVIARGTGPEDTMFTNRYLESPAVPRVVECVKVLVDRFKRENVYLISKCGDPVQRKSMEWLHHTGFFRETGHDKENVRFCRQRHEKAGICQKLGITHFVDDRPEVLSYMYTVPELLHFGKSEDVEADIGRFDYLTLRRITSIDNWPDITISIVKSSGWRPTNEQDLVMHLREATGETMTSCREVLKNHGFDLGAALVAMGRR